LHNPDQPARRLLIYELNIDFHMNKFFSSLLAGIVGGALTIGAWQMLQPKQIVNQAASEPQSRVVNYGGGTPPSFDFTRAADRSMNSVVHIKASESRASAQRNQQQNNDPFEFFFGGGGFGQQQPKSGTGSGVIYSSDGYIITNNHVVDFADEFLVTLHDNREFKARMVGRDPNSDMAVIKIEAENLSAISVANSDQVLVGEWALAVGNPFDLSSTVTAGIISAKGRDIGIIKGKGAIESFIQTDAAVNPGNSGGALVNLNGELIGINSAIASPTGTYAGYAFAIPSNLVRRICDDLIKYGTFKRAYLGVDITPMDNALAKEWEIDFIQGVAVVDLDPKGSAAMAGVVKNDVITRVNNKRITTTSELQEAISQSKVGDDITVIVNRKGREKEIPVKMRTRTAD
jgi:serine protease Do